MEVDWGGQYPRGFSWASILGDSIFGLELSKHIKDKIFISYAQDFSSTAYEVSMEFDMVNTSRTRQSIGLSLKKDTENQRKTDSAGLFWKKEW